MEFRFTHTHTERENNVLHDDDPPTIPDIEIGGGFILFFLVLGAFSRCLVLCRLVMFGEQPARFFVDAQGIAIIDWCLFSIIIPYKTIVEWSLFLRDHRAVERRATAVGC
jgi:hypothetical protein